MSSGGRAVLSGARVLVTGVAGFIGSWVAETLLRRGHEVLGVDCFTDFYPRSLKEANVQRLREWSSFSFAEADLAEVGLDQLRRWMSDYPLVCHEAAQAGVRSSGGKNFEIYLRHNVLATQKLLEAAKEAGVRRLVYASSSSVYGRARELPLREEGPLYPVSPYGVTKLAGEHLCRLYHLNHGVPTVALRYFTVYGPRQRPDMAFHRLIRAALTGEPFLLYGDGRQIRSFTYVADAVRATLAALLQGGDEPPFLGEAVNVGGGSTANLGEAIALVEEIIGRPVRVERSARQAGDVEATEAELSRARDWLGYEPRVSLREGLQLQVRWQERVYGSSSFYGDGDGEAESKLFS